MKPFFLTILLTSLFMIAYSQDGNYRNSGHRPNREQIERIHAAKMAYIADRIKLKPEQSAKFIPVYNEFEKEKMEMRKSFRQKYKGTHPDELSDEAAMTYIDDDLDYQEQLIKLKRKYNDRFLQTIYPQQLADLSKAEREFNQKLMQRFRQRNGNGEGNRWENRTQRGN